MPKISTGPRKVAALFLLPPEMLAELRALAEEEGVSMASLVREALATMYGIGLEEVVASQ